MASHNGLIAGGTLLYVVCLWAGILWLLSRISGWRKFPARFPYRDDPATQWKNWQSARVGVVGFNHALKVGVSPLGLSLRMQPGILFSFFFPPFTLPWDAIRGTQREKFLLIRYRRLQFNDPTLPRLQLQEKALEHASARIRLED